MLSSSATSINVNPMSYSNIPEFFDDTVQGNSIIPDIAAAMISMNSHLPPVQSE